MRSPIPRACSLVVLAYLKRSLPAALLLLIVLQGCITNSTLHLTKNKKSIITTSSPSKSQDSLFIPSVLGPPMSWSTFINGGYSSGRYSIHLINYSTQQFVEARFIRTDKNLTYLDVLVSDFYKKELAHYEFSYSPEALSISLSGTHDQSYRVSVKANSASGLHNDLFVTKAANFVIEKGLLHLYTGEVASESGMRGKFIVTNDPVEPVRIETSIWYLLLIGNEVSDCTEKLKAECKDRGLKLESEINRYVGTAPNSSPLLPRFRCTGFCIEK